MVATIRPFMRGSPPRQPSPTVRSADRLLHLRMPPTEPSWFRAHSEATQKEIAMKAYRALAVSLAASLAVAVNAASAAVAPNESGRLSSQYSDWAGGRSNADALVTGLRNGAPVTIVTPGPNNTV